MPKEETFPIPLKYIDVTRSAHTDLDVMQEQRMDDCWIVDSNRSLSAYWKGFTKFTLLLKEKNCPRDMCGPGGDRQVQNSHHRHLWYDSEVPHGPMDSEDV